VIAPAPRAAVLRWPWVAAVLLVAAPCAWIASTEWFSRDDFAFLVRAQRGPWVWSEIFLPFERRFWPFYRPLAMETFFWVGLRVFGLHAGGFFGVAVALHLASGVLVHRVARQWGFAPASALATALLSLSRPPSLIEIYWASTFHYVASRILGLAALALFQRHLRTRGEPARLASCLAIAFALLCNEVNAVLPLVLVLGAVAAQSGEPAFAAAARGLRRALPHLALVGAYLVFRFGLLAPSELRDIHTPALGLQALRNAWANLVPVFGGSVGLASAALGGAGVAAWLLRSRGRAGLPPALLRTSAVCLAWLAVAGAPFALLPFPQLRYAMPLEVPASLLVGAWLDAAFRAAAARRPRAAELALAAVAIAVVPYGALARRAAEPLGLPVRRLVEAVESHPGLRDDSRVIVLYGAPGLADAGRALRLRYLAYNGAALAAVHPRARMSLRFQDLAQRPPRDVVRPGTLYLALHPDLRLGPADPALLRRELPRGNEAARQPDAPDSP
jgi:hypothetical protein